MNLHNKKLVSTLFSLSALPLVASCGQDKPVNMIINSPCNQAIWSATDQIQVNVKSESLKIDETVTFSYDSRKGNLPIDNVMPDAVVSVNTLNKDGTVTAAITIGPMDMTEEGKLELNIAPGKVSAFNVTTEKEEACGTMVTGRIGHTATTLKDGRVMIIGGEEISSEISTTPVLKTEFYDPATSAFTNGPDLVGGSRKNHSALLLNDGKVLIAGGISTTDNVSSPIKSLYIYDPETNEFGWPENGGGYLLQPRANMSATLMPDGTVLLAGGSDNNNTYFDNIELWDPEKGISSVGSLKTARAHHTALLLPDGSVAFIGGQNTTGALDTVEIYKNGAIQSGVITMGAKRSMANAVVVNNNAILVTGGYSEAVNLHPTNTNFPSSLSSMELVKFNLGSVLSCSSMKNGRAQHQLALLPESANGQPQVLVTGGRAENGLPTSSAEIITINDTSNACKLVSEAIYDMSYSRAGHAQTILPGGDIFLVGGQSSSKAMANSAEYYTLPR